MSTTSKVFLSALVSRAFAEPHRALKNGTHGQLVLKGGRGSAKSSYASIEGVLLLLRHPEIHGVVMRKVSSTLRTSVYSQYVWAVMMLGLGDKFKRTVSPMELTYIQTGQKIMFFGADDPGKLKSIKVPSGYIGYLHFEELDQFVGDEEVRSIEQSALRGGPMAYEIKTFNPPRTRDNWANRYVLTEKAGQLIHHSTFRTTPREWLGERFLLDEEYLRRINPRAAEHEYDGIPTGTGGAIFDNLDIRFITNEEAASFDHLYFGLDHGFAVDPAVIITAHYDKRARRLYLLDEYYSVGATFDTIAAAARRMNPHGLLITADSAEPRSNDELSQRGLYVTGAKKGPGSVEHGIRWLQGLAAIVIDPIRCPNAAREFGSYEYQRDRHGNFISAYPDKENHTIDAVRYALESVTGQFTARIPNRRGLGI